MRTTLIALVSLVFAQQVDYSKVDRKITIVPKLSTDAKYALLLPGDGKVRIWMVLDKSRADKLHHDVLYFDRDGDGKVGEEGERIAGDEKEHELTFAVGKAEFPDAQLALGEIQFVSYTDVHPALCQMSFRVNRKVTVSGSFGKAGSSIPFESTPEKAPLLHADPFGTLDFLHTGGDAPMAIGEISTFGLNVGTKGPGPSTFMAVDETFLDLDKDRIFATLVAKDKEGKEIRERFPIKDHC